MPSPATTGIDRIDERADIPPETVRHRQSRVQDGAVRRVVDVEHIVAGVAIAVEVDAPLRGLADKECDDRAADDWQRPECK